MAHRVFALLWVLALWLSACGPSVRTVWDEPPASEAEEAYRTALAALESGKYIDATNQFNELRLKYPYSSRWTTLAELRLADALSEQGRYAPAALAYAEFITAHPTHEEVPYAQYQIGLCAYEQMPGDYFFLPDPEQRELSSTKQAETAFKRLLARFPEHEKAADAAVKLAEVRERLALYELFVAEFNFSREAYLGAVNRLVVLTSEYAETPQADDGLLLLARCYLELKDVEQAVVVLDQLVSDYPDSEYVGTATDWLASYRPR